jgi:hypothetical protein
VLTTAYRPRPEGVGTTEATVRVVVQTFDAVAFFSLRPGDYRPPRRGATTLVVVAAAPRRQPPSSPSMRSLPVPLTAFLAMRRRCKGRRSGCREGMCDGDETSFSTLYQGCRAKSSPRIRRRHPRHARTSLAIQVME